MSTQPISEIATTQNVISKTVEIATTGPDLTPIDISKFGTQHLTIQRPLSHKYDVMSLLSNWRLFTTITLNNTSIHNIHHNLATMNALAAFDLVKYVTYIKADLQVRLKIISNAQQVGAVAAFYMPATKWDTDDSLLDVIHYPFDWSSLSWKLIPLGINSDHEFTIPWMSTIPYWRRGLSGQQIYHGTVRFYNLAPNAIETVPYTPTVQVFIRYINVEVAGMNINA